MAEFERIKRFKGLKNGAFVVITEEADGTLTYGEKINIDLVELSFSPEGESDNYYANDVIFDQDEGTASYEISVTMPNIPDALRVAAMGFAIDDEGMIYESESAPKKEVGFIFQTKGNSEVIFQFHRCTLGSVGGSFGTNTDKMTSNDVELKVTATIAPNGMSWSKITKAHSKFNEALDTIVEPIHA